MRGKRDGEIDDVDFGWLSELENGFQTDIARTWAMSTKQRFGSIEKEFKHETKLGHMKKAKAQPSVAPLQGAECPSGLFSY